MKRVSSRARISFSMQSTLAALLTIIGLWNTIAPAAQAQPVSDKILPRTEILDAPEPAFWIPVARLDPNKPQRIRINNKTGLILDYLVTTHTDFRTLDVGKSVTLSNIDKPLFLNINSQESNYSVKYSVSVDKKTNTLIVTVKQTDSKDSRVLNINETGAVYTY